MFRFKPSRITLVGILYLGCYRTNVAACPVQYDGMALHFVYSLYSIMMCLVLLSMWRSFVTAELVSLDDEESAGTRSVLGVDRWKENSLE